MSTAENIASPSRPIVITPVSLSNFLTYSLRLSNRVHLIICSTQPHFLQQLSLELDSNHPLLSPTLDLLARSSAITTAFCPTVQTLLAYLAAFPVPVTDDITPNNSTIALVFPLSVHVDTAAYSAQGLSRMFASMVEASVRSHSQFLIIEPVTVAHADDENSEETEPKDPWEKHVSILNTTTSKFRIEQRGWVGRTVSARTVAERWCVFRTLDQLGFPSR
jgi:hypothetical protein